MERGDIPLRNAADCDGGNGDAGADLAQLLVGDADGALLGRRREHRAHAQIVGALALCALCLFDCLCRRADDEVLPCARPNGGDGRILDADVNAVRARRERRFIIVVDDERNAVTMAELRYAPRFLDELLLGKVLFAQLNERYTALKRFFDLLIKRLFARPRAVGHGVEQQHVPFKAHGEVPPDILRDRGRS